jgi:hypothetical protein
MLVPFALNPDERAMDDADLDAHGDPVAVLGDPECQPFDNLQEPQQTAAEVAPHAAPLGAATCAWHDAAFAQASAAGTEEDSVRIWAGRMFEEGNGMEVGGALWPALWRRFSNDQCATWIMFDRHSAERFVEWVESGLDPQKAWS